MTLVLLFGIFITAVGAIGVVVPDALLGIARYTATPIGLYVAAAVRIVVGILLLRVAAGSRFPMLLRALGALAITAGIVTAAIGIDRARAILDWWAGLGPVGMRLFPAIALLFGIIILAARPRRA